MMKRMPRKRDYLASTIILKGCFLVLFFFLLFTLAGSRKANAAVALNPAPGPIPFGNWAYLVNSDSYPQTPAFTGWVSQQGTAVQNIDVPYGTTSIPLEYHFAAAIGWEPQFVTWTQQLVLGASVIGGGSTSGIGGQVLNYGWVFENYIGAYGHQSVPFTFTPPSGSFTSDASYTIVVTSKTINNFAAFGTYTCVGTGIDVAGWDFNNCGATAASFTVNVHVINPPPVTPTVSAVCNGTTSELNISWAGSSTGSAGGFSVDVSAPNNPAHTANNYYSKAVGTATSTTAPNGFNLWPGGAPAMPALVPGATYYVWVWNGISSPPTSVVANSCTPPPTVSLLVKGSNDAAPTTTPNPILVGGTIALTWSSTNATSCTASDQWAGTPIGTSQAYPPGQDRTPDSATPGTKKYTITCSGPGGNSPPATVTINVIPPATATLTAAGPDGSNIVEVNDPVTVTWTSQNATSCSSGGQWAGTAVNPLNGGSVTRPSDTTTTGTKTYTLTCSNSVSSVGPIQATIAVAVKPYVRTYGGDVESGAAFKDSSNNCSINNNAGIIAYNKGSNAPPNAGAGVQYLAQSYSSIYQFASAALRASVPAAPFGLSPDNTNAPWGGGFGSASCAEDYSNAASTGTAGNSLGGSYTNLTPSTHIILKHTGDIFIDSDVTYQTSGWTSTQIPSFYLIVTGGNIYIKNTVSQLDGVYIAQSAGGKGGTIYTCASGAGSAYLGGSIYDNCSQQLTVNGAFIADQIKFLRSFGSLSNGTQGESPAGSGHNCYASGTVISQPVCAAEIFNYGPELWLNGPGLFPADSQKYDSITGLPPVL